MNTSFTLSAPRLRAVLGNGRRRGAAGFLFVLPALAFTTAFFVVPLLMSVWMSFHDWPLLGSPSFTGIENYAQLAQDKQFRTALGFTLQYTLMVTPLIFLLAFGLAMLVNNSLRGTGIFRTAYFLPVVIGLGVSSLLWVWLLNDRVGVINAVLVGLGLIKKPIIWLGQRNLALGTIVVSIVWKTVGFSMVLLLTGLQAIPGEYYEAAMVDGASAWGRLVHITLPLLRRTLALALVLSVIGSVLAFDQFYIMTRGGPQNQTITAVYWIFLNSFTYFKMGYGAALSLFMMVFLVLLSIIQLFLLRDDSAS